MIRGDALARRLARHVGETPDAPAFVFYRRHDDPGEVVSWRALWQRASRLAEIMRRHGCTQGAGVVMFCDDEGNLVLSLVATWMAGAVAIPATGGLNAHLSERNRHIFASARPDLVVHDLPDDKVPLLLDLAPGAGFVNLREADMDLEPESRPASFEAALLQFTSGSTSRPKPVLLDGQALDAGCATIEAAFGLGRSSVGVHWLPLYHDMGLIGGVVVPLWTGGTSVLLRSSIFIQRPLRWMQFAAQWRATITSAPNFAYDHLCASVDEGQIAGLDLSSLATVIIGGEPVHQRTVERLLSTFGPCGLTADAIAPCYGMAEVTLLASSGREPDGPRFSTRNCPSSEFLDNLAT